MASFRVAAVRELLPEGLYHSSYHQRATVRGLLSERLPTSKWLLLEGFCQSSDCQSGCCDMASVGVAAVIIKVCH